MRNIWNKSATAVAAAAIISIMTTGLFSEVSFGMDHVVNAGAGNAGFGSGAGAVTQEATDTGETETAEPGTEDSVPVVTMSPSDTGSAAEDTSEDEQDKEEYKVGCSVPSSPIDDPDRKIRDGIFAGSIDLSGMTADDAIAAINSYVAGLDTTSVTLRCVSGNEVSTTAGDLGVYWSNMSLVNEALSLGRSGNVVKRFKELTDLKHTNKVYDIELSADRGGIKNFITASCKNYDIPACDATISRKDGKFNIVPGNDGQAVNAEESAKVVEQELTTSLTGEPKVIDLVVDVEKPRGDTDTLSRMTDVLGTFTTKFTLSGKDRVTNVANGCRLLNGTLIYPGEQISVTEEISPMTEENGYALAGSYLNGLVVESFGGGICQVSTTLYQAVLRAELQVDERYNHSMVINYADHSCDAAIAEGIKDFKFTNNQEYPVYIDGYTTPDKTITFTIYGVETRPANRTIEFESVDLEEIQPQGEQVVADSSQPAGFTKKQSAHIGYKSELYKIVKVDGVETERILVNKSTYKAVPAILTVGTATSDPAVKAALDAAIATQSIDYAAMVASGTPVPAPAAAPAEGGEVQADPNAGDGGAAQ